MNGDFVYCQSEIEGGKRCETQCDHCKAYYAPMEDHHKHFLPHDIARCNRDDCPLHLECALHSNEVGDEVGYISEVSNIEWIE